MHDYDPFEDFIGGMSMPELPIGAPIPVSGEELLDVPSAVAKQIRTLIRARIEKYIEHPAHHWDDQLDVLQLLIRDEVSSTVTAQSRICSNRSARKKSSATPPLPS